MHLDVTKQKSHFMREFKGKMPRPRRKQNSRGRLCASLRSRNTPGHVTKAILCGNLQGKCRALAWAPRSSTGLYPYRKNPSVWTHCLGKNAWICWSAWQKSWHLYIFWSNDIHPQSIMTQHSLKMSTFPSSTHWLATPPDCFLTHFLYKWDPQEALAPYCFAALLLKTSCSSPLRLKASLGLWQQRSNSAGKVCHLQSLETGKLKLKSSACRDAPARWTEKLHCGEPCHT